MPSARTRVTDSPAFRRAPKQVRGQRRVAQILEQAEVVFSEVGFENATTNLIASRAGISIGSLYQFFSSKEAILEAMAERYLHQMLMTLANKLDSHAQSSLADIIEDLLRVVIKLQERRPYFLQCLTINRPSPVLARTSNEMNAAVASHVKELMIRKGAKADMATLELRARICVETMGALLPFVLYARGRARTTAAQEVQLMLQRYLQPMLPPEASS